MFSQILTELILDIFFAKIEYALLLSRKVIELNLSVGISGAFFIAIRQFVLAGFPTTITLTSFDATSFNIFP